MSTYKRLTRNPTTGKYSNATWHDDYFAPHFYGVEFEDDPKIYPADFVEQNQLKEFWAHDVLEAIAELGQGDYKFILKFLDLLDKEYKARWKRDPLRGEGAVDNLQEKLNRE